jgi:tetratricopeptide (TPR) repeat protein
MGAAKVNGEIEKIGIPVLKGGRMKSRLRRFWLIGVCLSALAVASVPVAGQGTEGEEDTGVAVLEFLEEKEEGNLVVDLVSMRPAALPLFQRALFLFKQGEKRRTYWGVTKKSTGEGAHEHEATLDGRGNGVTSVVNGHSHDVKAGVVQEAEGHKHEMMKHKDPQGCGNLGKRAYFHHVLGMTTGGGGVATPGKESHHHMVTAYFQGAMGRLTSPSEKHVHICRNFKVGKTAKRGGPQGWTEDPKGHAHEVRWIAKSYFDFHRWQYVADLFEEASRKNGTLPQAHYYQCICLQTILEFDIALKSVEKAIRAIPDFYEALVERGDINMWLGNYPKAHQDYKKALEINPAYAHAHFMDAMCSLREANFVYAEKAFTKSKESSLADVKTKLASIEKKAKKHLDETKQEALKALTTAHITGELKELGKAIAIAMEVFKGQDRAWVNKVRSVCQEYLQSRKWLVDLEKEKTFPGWKGYTIAEEDHYIVKGNREEVSQDLAEYFAGQMESAYKLYRTRFKIQKKEKVATNVFIYTTHKSYVKDGAPPNSGGYQHPYFNKIVCPINGRDYKEHGFSVGAKPSPDKLVNTQLVLFHEAFHKYLNKFLQRAPQCFNEGCADYFGPSKFKIKKVSGGWVGDLIVRINPWRLRGIQGMIQNNINLPLEPFWKETKGEMYGSYGGQNYAQAWAWVFFLFEASASVGVWKEMPENKKPARKHFKLLGDYYKALRKGKGLNRAWDASFGRLKRKLSALEEEWKEFIMGLK